MKITHNTSCKMAFGRPSKHSDCPRCEELKNGAETRRGWGASKREMERLQIQAIRSHNCAASKCGPVCTANEW